MVSTSSSNNIYLNSFAFNQDYSCFVCGTTAGFRVFVAWPIAEVHRREGSSRFQDRRVILVKMLLKTNIFAMVTVSDDDPAGGGVNKVQIWDERNQKFVGELRSRYEVKGIQLRRDIIVMVTEHFIYVYTCDRLQVILHLTTITNARGLCALAAASDPFILCCPGQSVGAVRVQVGQDDRATHVFQAHQTGLAALTLNASGSLVATASENGTVVKVFQTSDGQLLYRLRRSTRPAAISCLTFRPDDRFLAVSSSSSTVHIFKLDSTAPREHDAESFASPALGAAAAPLDLSVPSLELEPRMNPGIGQIAAQIQKAVTKVASVAGAESVTDVVKGVIPTYFNDLRSFAQFRIPDTDSNGTPSVDTRSKQAKIPGPLLSFHPTEPKLLVLHYSGVLYECSFRPDLDSANGLQECGFVRATTWFAVRPDFKVQGPGATPETVRGDGDEGGEGWQLL